MIFLQDPENFGCLLRDVIYRNFDSFKINGMFSIKKLKNSLDKVDIPEEYWGDITKMFMYRSNDRIKDFVEEAIFDKVCQLIVKKIIH